LLLALISIDLPRADFYFCIDDPVAAFENVEIAPDGMSDAGTAFTRYTVNPTTLASSTRKSS
jgi:elongator complex protein 1